MASEVLSTTGTPVATPSGINGEADRMSTLLTAKGAEILVALKQKVDDSLSQATSASQEPLTPEQESFMKTLTAYMEMVLALMVTLAKNQSQIDGAQNNMASNFVKLSQDQQQKAEDNYKKYQAAVEAAKHESLLDKIFGGLGMVLGFAIGMLTGDIALCAMSVAMGVMMFSGGSAALDDALQSIHSDILRTLVKGGIDLGIAGGISGLSGAIEAKVAESAIAAGIKEEAEEAGAKTFTERATAAAKSSFTQNVGMSTMIVNPFTDLTASFIDMLNKAGANISDKTKKLIADIVGTLMAFAVAAGTVAKGGAERISSGLSEKMTAKFGEGVYDNIKLGLGLTSGGFNAASTAFGIELARSQLKQAGAIDDLGDVKQVQQIYNALVAMLNARIQASIGGYKDIMGEFAQISERWDLFVKPAADAARGMN